MNNFNPGFYQDYIDLVNKSHINSSTLTEEVKNSLLEKYMNIIYNNFGKIENMNKIFELGISYGSINIASLKGKTKNFINESFITKSNPILPYKVNDAPIYSYTKIYGLSGTKCFTYFSAINEYWR